MKAIIFMLAIMSINAMAEEKKDLEVCTQISKKDKAFYCKIGNYEVIHFVGQMPTIISNPPMPVATPSPEPIKKK